MSSDEGTYLHYQVWFILPYGISYWWFYSYWIPKDKLLRWVNAMEIRHIFSTPNSKLSKYNWYMLVLCILAHKRMKWNHVWNHDWWVSCVHHSFWIPSLHASLKLTTKTQLLCFFTFPWWTFNKFTSNWSQTSSIHSATCAPVTAKSGTRSRSINAFWLPVARNLAVKTEFAIHVHHVEKNVENIWWRFKQE